MVRAASGTEPVTVWDAVDEGAPIAGSMDGEVTAVAEDDGVRGVAVGAAANSANDPIIVIVSFEFLDLGFEWGGRGWGPDALLGGEAGGGGGGRREEEVAVVGVEALFGGKDGGGGGLREEEVLESLGWWEAVDA